MIQTNVRSAMTSPDTQLRILDTAERLFAERGFAETSLRMLTREANVNLAAVHYHFGSKERLFVEVVSRIVAPVGIAYGSDTERAIQLLLEVGKECPFSVAEPAPNVVFSSFGESSLDFELRVFVAGREIKPRVLHDLHMRIDAAFRAADIEIAFPQRDLHVRSVRGWPGGPVSE